MDKGQEIAISRIADILSSSNLVIPSVDIWKKIFNNAGLSDLYETRSPQFTTRVEIGRASCRERVSSPV